MDKYSTYPVLFSEGWGVGVCSFCLLIGIFLFISVLSSFYSLALLFHVVTTLYFPTVSFVLTLCKCHIDGKKSTLSYDKVLSVTPWVDQNTSPIVRNSDCLISAFQVHSAYFFFQILVTNKVDFSLWFNELFRPNMTTAVDWTYRKNDSPTDLKKKNP